MSLLTAGRVQQHWLGAKFPVNLDPYDGTVDMLLPSYAAVCHGFVIYRCGQRALEVLREALRRLSLLFAAA